MEVQWIRAGNLLIRERRNLEQTEREWPSTPRTPSESKAQGKLLRQPCGWDWGQGASWGPCPKMQGEGVVPEGEGFLPCWDAGTVALERTVQAAWAPLLHGHPGDKPAG